MWYVCSDIHIGTAASRQDYFNNTLVPKLKSGDTLVLLGDIFDYWISSFELGLKQLSAGWSNLITRLEQLRAKGIDIIFVPGNHDSFVFYNEYSITGDVPTWLDNLYRYGGRLARVRDATTLTHALSDVATIVYPAFVRSFGDTNVIFTHGHWSEQIWPFITDDPNDPLINDDKTNMFLKRWARIKANIIAFSYENPDLMRRLFLGVRKLKENIPYFFPELLNESGGSIGGPVVQRELDPLVDVRRTEDILFTVASDVYQNFYSADALKYLTLESGKYQDEFASKLHGQLKSYVGGSEDDPLVLLGRERGSKLIDKWTIENNPDSEWARALQRMTSVLMREVKAYSIEHRARGELIFPPSLKDELLQPLKGKKMPVLIHGHFHLPRRGRTVIDDGCMLSFRENFKITTYVRIDATGHIYGPAPEA